MTCTVSRAQRLKRVFHIDIETCRECSGNEDHCLHRRSVVIQKILDHLKDKAETTARTLLPHKSRAPPAGLFG